MDLRYNRAFLRTQESISPGDVRRRLHLLGPLGVLSLLGVFSMPAKADLTLVVQQTAMTSKAPNSEQPGPIPQTLTLRFKDGNARVDLPDERAMLYGKDGIIHTLQPKSKVYITNFVSEIEAADDPLPPGSGAPMTEETKLDLRRTNLTETILGFTARQYHLTGTVTLTRIDPAFANAQGGQSRGMGLMGLASFQQPQNDGQGKHGGKKPHLPNGPVITIDGDVWLSENLKVPAIDSSLTLAQLLAPNSGPLLKSLADTLNGRKALLLQARVTVISTPLPPSEMAPDPPPNTGSGDKPAPQPPLSTVAPPAVTTVSKLALQSYSVAALPSKLFQTPSDYNLIGGSPVLFMLGAPPPAASK